MKYLIYILSYIVIRLIDKIKLLYTHIINVYTRAYICNRGGISYKNNLKLIGYTYFHIGNNTKLHLGKELIIRSGNMNAIDIGFSKIVVEDNASLVIGDYSGMSNTIIQCYHKITIGNYVNIGAGCIIMDSNFHSMDWHDRKDRKTDVANSKVAPVEIGDYAFIGARSIICKGVTIGKHSVIAAGSVVVKDIPDDQMWGGNPAKLIKIL